jgi:cytidylate kinase
MSVITIDGPAGAGKSTVSKELARRLAGYTYLDTGAMYRAIAWAATERGIDLNDVEALADLCSNLDLELRGDRVFLDRRDISSLIRTPEMDSLSSAVSQVSTVRESLTRSQREIGRQGNIVAEGRDMGTVVFPNAHHKFFLTASPEERARRRKRQLEELGEQVAYEDILLQINARDRADSTRPVSPLRPAPDSVRIDSSDLTVEEILEMIIGKVRG